MGGVSIGRPTLRDQRRAQILEAFEACVARYGVQGATLERTAAEAGLARALIRHNVGNRADLLEAALERFLQRARDETAALLAALPATRRSDTMIEILFDPRYFDSHLVRLSEALIAAAAEEPALARRMRKWLREFTDALAGVLRDDYPGASAPDIEAVAVGILGLYFNVESLSTLGAGAKFNRASKRSAHLLLRVLETPAVPER